jgi:ubiquinol-cytochrome c reductase cytochrome b subunit
VGVIVFLILFCIAVFFTPELGGYFLEHDNFVPADPLKTPEHIKPLWYFTPFYAVLRAVPDKFLGVVAMGAAIVLLFFLPWLDRSPVKSIRYRGTSYKLALVVISFLALGYLGGEPATPLLTNFARVFSILYFAFFAALLIIPIFEKTKPVPDRVTS